ncbi:MAG: tRNA 2-thiocytidine(32) synthetase TtcA [Lachnospiraceae bacterium]|nr:tRNA 2-thiocytidine(32) synthetase TtcA [Lachnospiraceae bacterium]
MKLQQILSLTRKAIDDYHMIEPGDKIAIGISGGKDSLTLLYALHGLKRFYPIPFELCAVTVDLGFDNLNLDKIKELCASLEIEYHIIKTDIGQIIFEDRKESNPCSLCAKMRKGALNDAMKATGYNKVAYAHHKDDVVETMMMSLIYEGRFHTFRPVTYLDRTGITVIRPLIYMKEADIIGFVNKYDVPVVKSPCPADGHTKREYVKNLVHEINLETPGVKERMFTAIQSGNLEGWELKGHNQNGNKGKQ